MSSSISSIQQLLVNTTAAHSQLNDTDMADAISQFQQGNLKIEAATLAQVHKIDSAKEQMSRLLG